MKPVIPTLSTALFILTALTGPALGATIHVPADQPTIQTGLDAASDGDEVVVGYGVYVENIDFPDKAITLRGLELFGNLPVIDGNQSGAVVKFESLSKEPVLDGFKITNGIGTYYGGGIGIRYSTSMTIMNCDISDNIGTGINCQGGSPLIATCTISGNIATGAYYEDGGGISCGNGAYPTIMNCIISGNHAGEFGGGIAGSVHSMMIITNCTITENSAGEGGGAFASAHTNAEAYITNSILWGNSAPQGPEIVVGYYVGAVQDAELTVTYSDVQGGEAAALVMDPGCTLYWGEGNIDAIPLFLVGGDYHLSVGSPCVDAGHASSMYDDDCFPPLQGHDA